MHTNPKIDSIHAHYNFEEKIDEGAFGFVYKATSRLTGEIVAIKHMKAQFATFQDCMALKEVELLLRL